MMSSTSTVTNRNLQVFESENRCDTFVLDLSHRGIGLDELSEWSLSVDLNNQAQFPGQVAVRLGFNSLGNLGAQFVGEFLTEDNAIGSLDLCFNDIDDIGIQKLSESLTLNSTLRILHISGNRVTANGFKYIAYALQQNAHLQSLYATGNSAGADGCYAIAQALCINQTLRTLCLSGNKIGPTGAAHLSAALCHNSHLRELVLSDNQLGDDGIRELSNALHHNRQLELLDVSFNGISSAGAEELCHSLVDYSSLKSLLLDNNKLRDAGAKSVASILPSMRLHVLNVGFNEIETDGVAAILLSILPNETMTTLSLSGNSINNDVSLVIANILKQDRVLMQLNLDHINVGAMGERNIAVGIATNMFSALQSLTGFHLGQVLVQLGSPPTLATMPNDHALRYLHSMWSLHLGGDNHGNFNLHATTTPPPAVLGSNVPPVEVQTSSISSPATGKTKVPVVYSTEAPDQGRTRSSFYGTGCSNSGVSVTAVSTLLDSINFIGSRQTANKNNSISYNTPSSPGASFPIASAECMDPVSSSSVSQLHVGTMTNEGANSSHIVTSPSKLSFNRSSSFACAQALSSAMMEFDRLYREIEGDDLLGLDDILATEQKESGQMEEVLSSVPSHSGTESNENDMTDSADDVADIDALEQRNEALENGALWSHTLRLQMQQTPDFQISENIKDTLTQIAGRPFSPMDLWELHQYYFSPPVQSTSVPTGGLFARSRTSSTSSINSLVDRPATMSPTLTTPAGDCSSATQPLNTNLELGLGHLNNLVSDGQSTTGGSQETPRVRVSTGRVRDHASTTTQSSTTASAITHFSSVSISHTKRKKSLQRANIVSELESAEEPLSSAVNGPAQFEQRPWKRAGNATTMARIHYYPRLANAMEQMKARADDARSLTLLRQLRYLESEQGDGAGDSLCAADVDVEELLLASLAAVYADSN